MIEIVIRATKSYINSIVDMLIKRYSTSLNIIPDDNNLFPIVFPPTANSKMLLIHSGDWHTSIVLPKDLTNVFVLEFSAGDKEKNCKGSSKLEKAGRYIFIEKATKDMLFAATTNIIDGLIKEGANYKCKIDHLSVRQKDHLIALSILCQGYLAAHGKIELPKGISISDEKKQLTLRQGWWEPAFADVFEKKKIKQSAKFQQTTIYSELTSSGKDCEKDKGAIGALFDAIKGLNEKDFTDTGKVTASYDCIKEILKGKQ